jgi:hypothetical protein
MKSIKFYFDITDNEFISTSQTVPTTKSNNLINNVYIRSPIYSKCGQKIGYKTSNDILQQLAPNKYSVRISNTYYIEGKGTINWDYSFINDKPNVFYPAGIVAESTIISGTGDFIGASGKVKLTPTPDGKRYVEINFC